MNSYDVYMTNAQSDAMLAFLSGLPSGALVGIVAKDAVDFWNPNKPHLGDDLKAYMASAFGAAEFGSLGFRDSYAFVGYKGAASPIAESHTATGTLTGMTIHITKKKIPRLIMNTMEVFTHAFHAYRHAF